MSTMKLELDGPEVTRFKTQEAIVPVLWNFDQQMVLGTARVVVEPMCYIQAEITWDEEIMGDVVPSIDELWTDPKNWGGSWTWDRIHSLSIIPPRDLSDVELCVGCDHAEHEEENDCS